MRDLARKCIGDEQQVKLGTLNLRPSSRLSSQLSNWANNKSALTATHTHTLLARVSKRDAEDARGRKYIAISGFFSSRLTPQSHEFTLRLQQLQMFVQETFYSSQRVNHILDTNDKATAQLHEAWVNSTQLTSHRARTSLHPICESDSLCMWLGPLRIQLVELEHLVNKWTLFLHSTDQLQTQVKWIKARNSSNDNWARASSSSSFLSRFRCPRLSLC